MVAARIPPARRRHASTDTARWRAADERVSLANGAETRTRRLNAREGWTSGYLKMRLEMTRSMVAVRDRRHTYKLN